MVALGLLCAIVVTGAAVRLTGSGLGCEDWPRCNEERFIDVSSTHGAIEQVNRLFTGLVTIGVVVAVLGAIRRVPRRPDLVRLAWGLVAAVIAGVAYAAYTEAGAVLIADGVRTTTAMAALFLGGGLLLSPTLPFLDNSWVAEGRGAVVLAYIGFVTLTLAYVAFGRGLAHLEPSTVVTLTILEPVVAAIASTLLLDQTLRPLGWFGAALVLAGLPLVALAGSDRTAGHD